MVSVATKTFFELQNLLYEHVRFTSDCDFFPEFDISCIIKEIKLQNNEIIFEVTEDISRKHLTVGSNMKNLCYEIIE